MVEKFFQLNLKISRLSIIINHKTMPRHGFSAVYFPLLFDNTGKEPVPFGFFGIVPFCTAFG
jgi:hypothetical protein